MKKLYEIYDIDLDIDIEGITIDSRKVKKGYMYVCIEGAKFDGHDFVQDAVKNGAVAILTNRPLDVKSCVIVVKNTRVELPKIMNKFCDYPSKKLTITGVTGTDGKTTTATIIKKIYNQLGNTCGYIGTNGFQYLSINRSINHTTPEAHDLFPMLKELIDNNVNKLAMEVSSHSLKMNRVDCINFDTAILTNISHEHLNFHKTMDDYIKSKALLFERLKDNGIGIINIDSDYYESFIDRLGSNYITYGINGQADFRAINLNLNSIGIEFDLNLYNQLHHVKSPLLGKFNVYNLLAAIANFHTLNYPIEKIIQAISRIDYISGRMEVINDAPNFKIIVDYAHTENGLNNLFDYIDSIKENKVIIVLGLAGERDTYKRPKIGKLVTDRADRVILTSQDPRSENPIDIINQMVYTINNNNYERIINRSKAIYRALQIAEEGDIVLITGKGNENYQKYNNYTVKFNDIVETRKHLKELFH